MAPTRTWKKAKDQAAKDEFQSYKDADTILVNGGPDRS